MNIGCDRFLGKAYKI